LSFKGKTAYVTGAGGGMGLAISRELVRRGTHVVMVDIKAQPSEVADRQGSFQYVQGDLTSEDTVALSMKEAFEKRGRLDYLVNAAGVLWLGRDKSAVEMDLTVWDQVLAINLKSMVHTARHAVPLMKKTGGGAMVHISSIQCLRGDDAPQDAYQASKGAILSLSKSLAIQFGPDRIRSNALLPGPTLTPMQQRWEGDEETRKAIANTVPLKRIGTPQDMANACVFLLSDDASFITGTELIVDGGLMARP
jgi:3-oxoacyl-[acyl-carrier protein] reductase